MYDLLLKGGTVIDPAPNLPGRSTWRWRTGRGPGMPQSLALEQLHMLAAEVFPRVWQG